MSLLAYAGAQATSTMYDDGVSNNPACMHVDKLDAHADDKARNGTVDMNSIHSLLSENHPMHSGIIRLRRCLEVSSIRLAQAS
jgi:hypothetical protein